MAAASRPCATVIYASCLLRETSNEIFGQFWVSKYSWLDELLRCAQRFRHLNMLRNFSSEVIECDVITQCDVNCQQSLVMMDMNAEAHGGFNDSTTNDWLFDGSSYLLPYQRCHTAIME